MLGFSDFLHKIDDSFTKYGKNFFKNRACGALSLGPLFLRSEVGEIFSKSSQNPSKTPMFLISENQLINFQSTISMFYVFHQKIFFIWSENIFSEPRLTRYVQKCNNFGERFLGGRLTLSVFLIESQPYFRYCFFLYTTVLLSE